LGRICKQEVKKKGLVTRAVLLDAVDNKLIGIISISDLGKWNFAFFFPPLFSLLLSFDSFFITMIIS